MTSASNSLAQRTEALEDLPLPIGDEERFAGWGVMALPFRSGHVLALRRWPASSIGPGYTSVWHRSPDGRWRMWQDADAELSCPRYFSAALHAHTSTQVEVEWVDAGTLTVRVPGVVDWTLRVGPTPATRLMNMMAALMPQVAWRSVPVLWLMSRIAGPFLRLGRFRLVGNLPNGHRFRMGPTRVWIVRDSRAVVDGVDLGPIGWLDEQPRLGDFWIPQRGVLAHGRVWLDAA